MNIATLSAKSPFHSSTKSIRILSHANPTIQTCLHVFPFTFAYFFCYHASEGQTLSSTTYVPCTEKNGVATNNRREYSAPIPRMHSQFALAVKPNSEKAIERRDRSILDGCTSRQSNYPGKCSRGGIGTLTRLLIIYP